jgi:hypothetical protein
MIEHIADHFPWLAKLNANMRENIYQFVMFGVTQQLQVDMKAVVSMLVVGAVSAFGGAYINSERTAVELKQYAAAQVEFRKEVRDFFRENAVETRSVNDRLTRQEILLHSHIASAIDSALNTGHQSNRSGMNGNKNGEK